MNWKIYITFFLNDLKHCQDVGKAAKTSVMAELNEMRSVRRQGERSEVR